MSNAREYVSLLFPNGRAYSNVEDSEKFNNVIALQIDRVLAQVQNFQDQLWFMNDNFDPVPWEKRYDINVPVAATLEERRITVKSYMVFPQSTNRLSIDYLQNQLDIAGFGDVIISLNPSGIPIGILHGNNITGTENYIVGPDDYNSFYIKGTIKSNYYDNMLLLLMSIKPLDSAIYDDVEFEQALALDDSLTIALSDTLALAISQI